MPAILVDIGFGLATLVLGAIAGWWLRSREQSSAPDASAEEVRRAHEVLACLQRMASHVAREVGEHSSRVEEINEELASGSVREPAKIVNVVAKLIDANKSMQGRLDQAEDQLRQQARLVESHAAEARTDALTLVGNRRALDDQIARLPRPISSARARPFALAMIDLDKFKRFNDTYGHQAGDEVLRGVGRILQRSVPRRGLRRPLRRRGVRRPLARRLARAGPGRFGAGPQDDREGGVPFGGRRFQVTASLGVALVRPG